MVQGNAEETDDTNGVDDYSEEYLAQILTEIKTIALVGASSKAHRDSYLTMQALLEQWFLSR